MRAALEYAKQRTQFGRPIGSFEMIQQKIAVNAAEVKSLTRLPESAADVSVTLWDGTTLSGQLQEQELACKLASGLEVKVPVALVQEYQQPQPAPGLLRRDGGQHQGIRHVDDEQQIGDGGKLTHGEARRTSRRCRGHTT